MLSLVTPPDGEPIDRTEAKAHLRVTVTDEDSLIDSLIQAAREHVESVTRRALLTQTWDLKIGAFPCGDAPLELPNAPLVSVTSVSYVDTAGVTQTWASSNYTVTAPSGPHAGFGCITPVYGAYWPATQDVINAVTVRFVAGYGKKEDVPESIKAAMKVLIGTWFVMRQSVMTGFGSIAVEVPQTVNWLLWPFRAE